MAPTARAVQLNSCWRISLRRNDIRKPQQRYVSAGTLRYRRPPPPLPPPHMLPRGMTYEKFRNIPRAPTQIKRYPPPKTAVKICKEPVKTFNQQQLALLDPNSSRSRFISKDNPDGMRVGDVVLVRFRSGSPFAGVCLSVRRRAQDTAILLRNQLARVGTEMWIKVFSPLVVGMELVQRREKRARRARLYYMRKPKHDRGSLEGIVEAYIKQKRATGRGLAGGRARGKQDRPRQAGKQAAAPA